ncbi:hypothetical protein BCV69DRAFT_129160 [Microstroma glucosiphilum]|uniref:Uncharacterized protein n=1 Tax=Pseudomicrostroma glucosiphilum TaxID=1684307 RepID=A0A316TXZ6_9BASI|nr:hypothetical protein BCV69DRAFT_129160 [Pseudomicrostroma glucosiphilum]PWN17688.1 hypothetical protein BCV69DRAFT_129160 [Pseudomicrostroma glucosiphilum]
MVSKTSPHPKKADEDEKAASLSRYIKFLSQADTTLLSKAGEVARQRRGKTSADEYGLDAAKRPGVPHDTEPARVVKERGPRSWPFLLSPDGRKSPLLIWAVELREGESEPTSTVADSTGHHRRGEKEAGEE